MTAAIDRILGDDFDFSLLTEEEVEAYIALTERVVGKTWDLTPKQAYADALLEKVDWLLFGGSAGPGKVRWRVTTPTASQSNTRDTRRC